MKTYLVGGAVRDRLLGLPVTERDYVVVGATVEELLARGYRPVGKDFPVFLHPDTQEEYALARTERKTGPGYRGFTVHADPTVTLEEDLRRRDLTINALAEDESGRIIDFYGGQADLKARVLRHVSDAFAEDPVRILRVARFAARFADLGFRVAEETRALMAAMVESGEVDALVPERVWRELVRALGERQPSHFFQVLRDCGALERLFPEIARLWGIPQPARWHPEIDTGVHVMLVLDQAARLTPDTEVRFAALTHDFGKGTTPPTILPSHRGHEERSVALIEGFCRRFRVPGRYRDLARVVARYHGLIHKVDELRPKTRLRVLEETDAFRRPERFEQILLACEADYRGRATYQDRTYPQAQRWKRLLETLMALDLREAIQGASDPKEIPERIRRVRLNALKGGAPPEASPD